MTKLSDLEKLSKEILIAMVLELENKLDTIKDELMDMDDYD